MANESDIESIPSTGFQLLPAGPESASKHVFCGQQQIPGADCPNCKAPFVQMMLLDTGDARLELSALGLDRLPLLFCWRCNWAQDESQYRMCPDGSVELLKFRRGDQGDDFPYEDYPSHFPARAVELVEVSAAAPTEPRHQVGGRPYLIQGEAHALCRACGKPMKLLATVADDATNDGSFAGNSWVQVLFFLCVEDRVVASTQACD